MTRGGSGMPVCPGARAEVIDAAGDHFEIYAIGNIRRGNLAEAEARLQREGGAATWCKKSGGTVSAPCSNKFKDGGDPVFLVVAHPIMRKTVHLTPEVYEDLVDTKLPSISEEPACTCDILLDHREDCPWKQWREKVI